MNEQIVELDINKLTTSSLNPRLDLGDLTELIESIKRKGIEEPLIVRRKKGNQKWEVIVGERRYKAAQGAGLHTCPSIIRKYTDSEAVEVSIIENVMRKDLTALERATGINVLLEEYGERYPNQASLAYALGISPSTLSVWLSILDFDEELQQIIGTEKEAKEGKKVLPLSLAYKIKARVKEPEKQKELIQEALEKGWGDPKLERELEKKGHEKKEVKRPIFVSLVLNDFIGALREKVIIWNSDQRIPDVGETINITTPRLSRRVLKVFKNASGETVVKFGEVA